jgi:hypothetical protein
MVEEKAERYMVYVSFAFVSSLAQNVKKISNKKFGLIVVGRLNYVPFCRTRSKFDSLEYFCGRGKTCNRKD